MTSRTSHGLNSRIQSVDTVDVQKLRCSKNICAYLYLQNSRFVFCVFSLVPVVAGRSGLEAW